MSPAPGLPRWAEPAADLLALGRDVLIRVPAGANPTSTIEAWARPRGLCVIQARLERLLKADAPAATRIASMARGVLVVHVPAAAAASAPLNLLAETRALPAPGGAGGFVLPAGWLLAVCVERPDREPAAIAPLADLFRDPIAATRDPGTPDGPAAFP